jgi:hypothetical protein
MKISNPFSGMQITHHPDRASDEENASAILSIKRRTRFGWACVAG